MTSNHRRRATLALLLVLGVLGTFPVAPLALEKRAVAIDDFDTSVWNSGGTCRLHYYNVCTGWVWVWGEYPDGARIGVVADAPSPSSLLQAQVFVPSGAPCGRGYTGEISTYAADANGCPTGMPLAVQAFCPTSLFTVVPFGGIPVPDRFAVVVKISDPYNTGNPGTYGTDRPAAGPTGPQACGWCYPASRQTHSFMYGTTNTPLCPGSTFDDGICHAELFWDIDISCTIDVEESTWGTIKNLYR